MKLRMLFIPFFCSLASLASASDVPMPPEVEKAADSLSTSRCRWDEVKSWKAISGEWALGLDAAGRPLAIYDLSYPAWQTRLSLGVLGKKGVTAAALRRELQEARDARAESKEEKQQSEEAIRDLEQNGREYDEAQAEASFAMAALPPKFRAKDIGLSRILSTDPEVVRQVQAAERAVTEVEGEPVTAEDFVNSFVFERQEDGTYEASVDLSGSVGRVLYGTGKPRRMVGIACVKENVKRTIAWTLFRQAIKTAIGGSSLVNALVGTAITRYHHFEQLMEQSHRDRVTEMLTAAENGETDSPLSFLTADERFKAGVSVMVGNSGALGIITRIFQSPKKQWRNLLRDEVARSADSRDYLSEHDRSWVDLNDRFAVEMKAEQKAALLVLPVKKSSKRGPQVAIDYADPIRNWAKRATRELALMEVDFFSRFIPLWGTVIREVHQRLVQKPMDDARRYESRLASHLERRQASVPGESGAWETELGILAHQRVNPLELSRERSAELASIRKAALGIP
jgi:hypothetical protein